MLLDDELPGLTYLKMLCEQIPELEVVKAFNKPETLLLEFNKLDFDICILDIEMPQVSGLEVAKLLNGKPVIFTTAYKEYAVDAFDLDAIDYVPKPIKMERLQQAVLKAIKRVDRKQLQKPITLNTDKGKALINIDDFCYIKCSDLDSRDKMVQLNDGSTLCLKNISFEKLLSLLPSDLFCRVNKKEIIAIGAVKFFLHDEITTNIASKSGLQIKLSLNEAYRSDFIQKIKV